MKKRRRKICFVITSFIHYSRNLLVLLELNRRADIVLSVVIAGAALLSKYSASYARLEEMLSNDGIGNLYEVHFNVEGSKPVVKAKTAGLGIVEFSSLFNTINPDIVVVRGDRFEVLSAATAAALMNIPIAHIEGGDITGTIDESVRHVITKFAQIHFATNENSRRRIVQMGENPKFVFNFGSPDVEVVRKFSTAREPLDFLSETGSGAIVDPSRDFIMVSYHPVTSELDDLAVYTRVLLEAVHELSLPTLWFWPNVDAGAEDHISHQLRVFKDSVADHCIKFMRYVPPRQYLTLLTRARCLVGNSSAGIKECSYLGVPVVNIGSRQHGRIEEAKHVIAVSHDKGAIQEAIRKQLSAGRYPASHAYYKPNTSRNIAKVLATADLYVQKAFNG